MNEKIEQLKVKLSGYDHRIFFNDDDDVLTVMIFGFNRRSYIAHDFRENETVDKIVDYIKNYKCQLQA